MLANLAFYFKGKSFLTIGEGTKIYRGQLHRKSEISNWNYLISYFYCKGNFKVICDDKKQLKKYLDSGAQEYRFCSLTKKVAEEGITPEILESNLDLIAKNKLNQLLNTSKKVREVMSMNKEPQFLFKQFMSSDWPFPRRRHVWLFGPPLSGKSTLIRWAQKHGVSMAKGLDSIFHDEKLLEADCRTVYFDDFDGKWPLNKLINLMDGDFKVNPKMKPMQDFNFVKLQVIFITSKDPTQEFKKYWQEKAFSSRVNLVPIEKLENLEIDLK